MWKDVRRADRRRGVIRLRVMLCEAMHSPSIAVVSNSIHEAGVFLEQIKIYNEIEKQLGYMGSIQDEESEQANTKLFRSMMSMLFGGDGIADVDKVDVASRRNRAISVAHILGTKSDEILHLEDEEQAEEKKKEDTKDDTKEEEEVRSPSDNVEDEDERRKKNRQHLSREMVVELQELRDLNVRSVRARSARIFNQSYPSKTT